MFAPVQGDFRERTPMDLLRACEEKRFTGLIEIDTAALRGNVVLRAGEVASLSLAGATGDPLDAFLSLQEGRFVLRQQMATLDGRLTGDRVIRGSLGEHGPADVLRFCEGAGLSGEVKMTSGGRRLEALYDAGQMSAIILDGRSDADLEQAFRWQAGEFVIAARPAFEAGRRPDESGLQFLNVVELALNKVIEKAEQVRDTDTPQKPIPLVRKRRRPAPPPAEASRDSKVQIYFLEEIVPESPASSAIPSSTRHAQQGQITAELLEVPRPSPDDTVRTVTPDPLGTPTERRPAATPSAKSRVWLWVLLGAGVGAAIVAALVRMWR